MQQSTHPILPVESNFAGNGVGFTRRLPGLSEMISPPDSLHHHATSMPYAMPPMYRVPPGMEMMYRVPPGVASYMGMPPMVVQGSPGALPARAMGGGGARMGVAQLPIESFPVQTRLPFHAQEQFHHPAMSAMDGISASHSSFTNGLGLVDVAALRDHTSPLVNSRLPHEFAASAAGVPMLTPSSSDLPNSLHEMARMSAPVYPEMHGQPMIHDPAMIQRMMMQYEAYGHGMGMPMSMGMNYPQIQQGMDVNYMPRGIEGGMRYIPTSVVSKQA